MPEGTSAPSSRTSGRTSSSTRPTGHRGWPSKGDLAHPDHRPARSTQGAGGSRCWPRRRRCERAVGANVLLRSGDAEILVDFPGGEAGPTRRALRVLLRPARPLLEAVVAARAVDWSNALFLSCRFRAWRAGEFNEFVYNFFKSLSAERIVRAEAEARYRLAPPPRSRRWSRRLRDGAVAPHRQADLCIFGTSAMACSTCHLHGWQFDLETGRCLTAEDRHLRVRPAARRPPHSPRHPRTAAGGDGWRLGDGQGTVAAASYGPLTDVRLPEDLSWRCAGSTRSNGQASSSSAPGPRRPGAHRSASAVGLRDAAEDLAIAADRRPGDLVAAAHARRSSTPVRSTECFLRNAMRGPPAV